MEIELLGPITIISGARRQHVRAAKVRAILALLALNVGQTVSFDELVDELWTVCSLQNARNALQANVLRLRKQLEAHAPRGAREQLVQTAGNGYMLDLPPSSIDANLFQSLADGGHRLVECQPAQAVSMLEGALDLWRGPPLVDAGGGFRCRASAAALEERQITAQEDLIAALLQIGGERRAIPRLRELVARYPARERFCEQLMLALYNSGRRTEAIEVFHRARQWLGNELGLPPSHSLRDVYQAILVQQPDLLPQRAELARRSRGRC